MVSPDINNSQYKLAERPANRKSILRSARYFLLASFLVSCYFDLRTFAITKVYLSFHLVFGLCLMKPTPSIDFTILVVSKKTIPENFYTTNFLFHYIHFNMNVAKYHCARLFSEFNTGFFELIKILSVPSRCFSNSPFPHIRHDYPLIFIESRPTCLLLTWS